MTAGAGRRKDLYLLSGDDALLLELGPLLGDRYRTRPIDSADQLEAVAVNPWLLIIDATARSDARAQTARIEQQHPHAPLIILCADGKAGEWANQLARGTVSAVVERGMLSDSALIEALNGADLRMQAVATASTATALNTLTTPFPKRRAGTAILLLAAAAALTAVAIWYFSQRSTTAPAAATTGAAAGDGDGDGLTLAPGTGAAPSPESRAAAAAAAAATAGDGKAAASAPVRPVLELLSDARVAFRDEKNLLPRTDGPPHGDSALELYAQVLAQEPQNDEARDGLRRLFSVARSRIQSDLAGGKLDEATHLLATFRDVGLSNDATARLEADIAAARPRWLVAQARAALASGDTDTAGQLITQIAAGGGDRTLLAELRRTLENRTLDSQLADLAGRARSAITAGALLEPAADSARSRLLAMQQVNRSHPLTLAVQHELQVALLNKALAASHAAQFDAAQQLLVAAAEYGLGAEVANTRRQLQADADAAKEHAAATAASREAPKPAAAASEPAPETDYVRARPTTAVTAEYPEAALRAGTKGYVIVEFTLNAKGQASDAQVIEANPPRVFDNAALLAVRRSRFDSAELGASGKPRRARLRVSFK